MLIYSLIPLVLLIGIYSIDLTVTQSTKSLHNNQSNGSHFDDHHNQSSHTQHHGPRIDETRTIEQFIVDFGYGYEKFWLTTSDGYILSIFKVYNPCLLAHHKRSNLDPIILGHPISQDPSIFIDGSPIHNKVNCSTSQLEGPLNKNLAFTLADLGFDVYLPCFRGYRYSRNHTTLNYKKDKAYWDFSFDEMGQFDAPVIVDFVLNNTVQSDKVIWIGHSLGFAIPLVLLNTYPNYSFKFKHLIGLAPAVFLTHTQHPATRFLADSGLINEKKLEIGHQHEKTAKEKHGLAKSRHSKETIKRLAHQFFYDYGYDPIETNVSRLPVFFTQETSTSISTYVHFAQLARSEHFKPFDGGRDRNLRKYGKPRPPTYKLSTIKNVTCTIMASLGDKAVAFRDIVKLVNTFKVPVNFRSIMYKKLNHFGFLWANDRDSLVNLPIIEILNRYTSLAYNVTTSQPSSKFVANQIIN